MADEGQLPGMSELIATTQRAAQGYARQQGEEMPLQRPQPRQQQGQQDYGQPKQRNEIDPRLIRKPGQQPGQQGQGQQRGNVPAEVQARIDEVTREKHQFRQLAEQAIQMQRTQQQQLQQLQQELHALKNQGQDESGFGKYNLKQLREAEINALDHKSESYSPAFASQLRDEIMRRELDSRLGKVRDEGAAVQKLAEQRLVVKEDTLRRLPEEWRREFRDESSEFFQETIKALNEFAMMPGISQQEIASNPQYIRSAILQAYGILLPNRVSGSDASVDKGELKRRESIASMGDSIVEESISPKSLFAQGKIDEGLLQMKGVQQMLGHVADIARFGSD